MKKLLLPLLCLLLLSACAQDTPRPARVTDEELAALREEYPYNDAASMAAMIPDAEVYPDFASLGSGNPLGYADRYAGVAVVEITSDWYELGDENPAAGSAWPVFDAQIASVLWGEGFSEGDTVTVGFGSTNVTSGMELDASYTEGRRYVMILVDYSDNAFGMVSLYMTEKSLTYYLTDEDVLLCVTSAPGPDSCSGMYVDTFQTEITALLDETAPAETAE